MQIHLHSYSFHLDSSHCISHLDGFKSSSPSPCCYSCPKHQSPNSSHHDSFKKSDQILSLLCSDSFNASHPNSFRLEKKKKFYSDL